MCLYYWPVAILNFVDKPVVFVVDIGPWVGHPYRPLPDLTFVVEYFEFPDLGIIKNTIYTTCVLHVFYNIDFLLVYILCITL